MKQKIYILVLLGLSLFISHTVLAVDENFYDYDTIIDSLSANETRSSSYLNNRDPFANVLLHAGVGMAMSMTQLKLEGESFTGLFRGVEVNFGIDLFSPIWLAETSYRNLGKTDVETFDRLDQLSLSEFDFKLVYRPIMGRLFRFRSSLGLSARYMEYFNQLKNQKVQYTTPAWMASLGFEAKLSTIFSIIGELGYRSAMIEETIDNSALAAGLRLDANF